MQKIIVKDLINSDVAVSPESAKPLFENINSFIEQEEPVSIDFSGLNTITTSFLNNSIGILYAKWERDELNKYVKINGSSLTDLQGAKLRMVMDNARTKLTNDELEGF